MRVSSRLVARMAKPAPRRAPLHRRRPRTRVLAFHPGQLSLQEFLRVSNPNQAPANLRHRRRLRRRVLLLLCGQLSLRMYLTCITLEACNDEHPCIGSGGKRACCSSTPTS